METDVAKVTLWKPEGLIKFRATQMSDNQHKLKQQKITKICLHIYSYRNTHYKTQLHNYE